MSKKMNANEYRVFWEGFWETLRSFKHDLCKDMDFYNEKMSMMMIGGMHKEKIKLKDKRVILKLKINDTFSIQVMKCEPDFWIEEWRQWLVIFKSAGVMMASYLQSLELVFADYWENRGGKENWNFEGSKEDEDDL